MRRILNIDSFFKLSENNINSREVDMQQLWNDYRKYRKEILNYIKNRNENTVKSGLYDEFVNYILYPIFKDKEVEFHRSRNIFDGEEMYGFSGRVKDIELKTSSDLVHVLVNLYDHKDTLIMTKLELFDDNLIRSRRNSLSRIIKVYDSEMTTFEIMFNTLDDVKKYNL